MSRQILIPGVVLLAIIALIFGIILYDSIESLNNEKLETADQSNNINDSSITNTVSDKTIDSTTESDKQTPQQSSEITSATGAESFMESGTVDSVSSSQASQDVQSATPQEYWVTGYVRSKTGEVIPKAKVSTDYWVEKRRNTLSAYSNQEGYYALSIPQMGSFYLTSLPSDDYLKASARVVISATNTTPVKDFNHTPAGLMAKGKVIDKENSEPVAGAEVTLHPHHDKVEEGQDRVTAVTNQEGEFELKRIAKGQFRIEVEAKGYLTYNPRQYQRPPDPNSQLRINENTQNNVILVELEKGFAATIQVVDSQERAVADANVRIHHTRTEHYSGIQGNTDNEGKITFDSLPDVTSLARVTKNDFGETLSETFEPGPQDNPTFVQITMNAPASVSGKVTKKDGEPVKDRRVHALYQEIRNRLGNSGTGITIESEKTNDEGEYIFKDLGKGAYRITVQGPEGSSFEWQEVAKKEITLEEGEEKSGVDFVLEDIDAHEEVRGKVVNANNEPIKEAQVNVTIRKSGIGSFSNKPGSHAFGRTDENGEFHIKNLKKGEQIHISVNHKEYQSFNKSYEMNGEYLTITLESSGSLKGIVLAKVTSEPIQGADIHLRKASGYSSNSQRATSGQNGAFEFEKVDPGSYRIQAIADKYALSEEQTITVKSGESTENIVIELDEGSEFVGVLLNTNGEPIANAQVNLMLLPGSMFSSNQQSTYQKTIRSGDDGMFRLLNVQSSGGSLHITHSDYATTRFEIKPEMLGGNPNTIRMTQGGRIIGTVYGGDGQPQKGVNISINSFPTQTYTDSAQTDENGEYAFEHVSSTNYMISRTIQKENFATSESKSTLVKEGETVRVDFGGGEGATISGTLYKEGNPVPNANVSLQQSAMTGFNMIRLQASSDENGYYQFKGIPHDNEYMVLFSTKDNFVHFANAEGSASVMVKEGQDEYIVDVHAAAYTINGIVKDAETGQPLDGVQIQMDIDMNQIEQYAKKMIMPTKSKGDGTFTLNPRESGTYDFTAKKDDYNIKSFQVVVPPREQNTVQEPVNVEVLLEKADTSINVFLRYNEQPIESEQVSFLVIKNGKIQQLQSEKNSEQKGVYTISGLSSGEPFDLMVQSMDMEMPVIGMKENVTAPKGTKGFVTMDMFEIAIYQVQLKSSDPEPPSGDFSISIPDFPIFSKFPTMQKIMGGMINFAVPKGHHLVKIAVPGYQPVEIYPDELANDGPAPMIKTFELILKKL